MDNFKFIIILHLISQTSQLSINKSDLLIPVGDEIEFGVLVSSFEEYPFILRVISPTSILNGSLEGIYKILTDKQKILALTNVALSYDIEMENILATFADLFPSFEKIGLDMDNSIMSGNRQKRGRFLKAMGRIAKPVKRVYDLSRGGIYYSRLAIKRIPKPIKTITSVLWASGMIGLTGYEIYEAIHSGQMYQQLNERLDILANSNIKSLDLIGNLTMGITNSHDIVEKTVRSILTIIDDNSLISEILIRLDRVFMQYLNRLNTALLIMMNGKLPTSLLSSENQEVFIKSHLPQELSGIIKTITPTLRIRLASIDPKSLNLIFMVTMPNLDSKSGLLFYKRWEPRIHYLNKCYTSPKPYYLLGIKEVKNVTQTPLIFDPDSCMTTGIIICESDGKVERISDLTENSVCTESLKNGVGSTLGIYNPVIKAKSIKDYLLEDSVYTTPEASTPKGHIERRTVEETIRETLIDPFESLQTSLRETGPFAGPAGLGIQ